MLGPIKKKVSKVVFFLEGKHPSFRDFICLGEKTALAQALSSWIEKGFSTFLEEHGKGLGNRSWRFWLRGQDINEIFWGILKDSSDSLGRPYPLVILLANRIPELGHNWELIPLIMDASWRRLELLASKNFYNYQELIKDISNITLHELTSEKFNEVKNQWESYNSAFLDKELVKDKIRKKIISHKKIVELSLLEIHDEKSRIPFQIATFFYIFKFFCPEGPVACFIGGSPEDPKIIFFLEKISKDSFLRLWGLDG